MSEDQSKAKLEPIEHPWIPVLAECERGEDVAKRAYEAALKKDLPSDVRSIVERQYQGVKQNHESRSRSAERTLMTHNQGLQSTIRPLR